MKKRITLQELLAELQNDKVNCGYDHGFLYKANYVDDTLTSLHQTVNRILDERLSKIEQALNPTF